MRTMRTWLLSTRAAIEKLERERRPSPAEALAIAELEWSAKSIISEELQDWKLRATLPGAIERGLEPLRHAIGRP